MTKRKWLFLISFFCLTISFAQNTIWKVEQGQIDFTSDAPLELIEASSTKLLGLIDPSEDTYAFAVNLSSFEGFNSPLQRQHFNENYLESTRYPQATFKGRIIEKLNFDQVGTYTIRAKGYLNIHGVEQERIIKSDVSVEKNTVRITSYFSVRLDDHAINIPHIVNQKIAEEIKVTVSATFKRQNRAD